MLRRALLIGLLVCALGSWVLVKSYLGSVNAAAAVSPSTRPTTPSNPPVPSAKPAEILLPVVEKCRLAAADTLYLPSDTLRPALGADASEQEVESYALTDRLWSEGRQKRLQSGNVCLDIEFAGAKKQDFCLPAFSILGAMKCGTTFLTRALERHPDVFAVVQKETFFFSWWWHHGFRGLTWNARNYSRSHPQLISDNTPFYIHGVSVPERVYLSLPTMKFIVSFRDPISRLESQYHHANRWLKRNNRPRLNETIVRLLFEEAAVLDFCVGRGLPDWKPLLPVDHPAHDRTRWTLYMDCVTYGCASKRCLPLRDTPFFSMHNHGHPAWGLITKSFYAQQLGYWLQYFPRRQFFVVRYEDLNSNASWIVNEIAQFLGLDSLPLSTYTIDKANVGGKYLPLGSDMRIWLSGILSRANEELNELLGVDFGWPSTLTPGARVSCHFRKGWYKITCLAE